ncbi:unnamed protein product, partial [Brassica rapa]
MASGGDEIVNIENSKVNEGSRSHEKARVNCDDNGFKRGTGKRKHFDDRDLVNTARKPKKKKKKNKEKIQKEDPEADLKKVKNLINGFSSNWKTHTTNLWSSIEFEFLAKVDIITMETKKTDEIMRDPLALRDGEEYYKRIEKAWKRGYFLQEGKISEDKEDESDEEASDLEEEIRVDKISERIDSLERDLEYLATGHNDVVKKNDSKKKSSMKVKLSVEDVKTNIPNAVSNRRISDPLREKLKEKGIEVLFPIQAMIFDKGTNLIGRARTGQGKTLAFVLPILETLINGKSDEIIFGGSLKHESLQKELKLASVKLTSKPREIKRLKHKLGERYKKLADMQSFFHFKERETNRTCVEFPIKEEKVSVVVSESETKSQLLSQAKEIVKRQHDEINTLQRALNEKEEEKEISIVVKRLEQEKLRETDANLKKQMEDWLITHNEVSKLQEEIEWEHFDVKGKELRKEAETINCQKEIFSVYLRGKFDNIQEERDSLRKQHKQKLDDNDVENLINKMKRLVVCAQSTSRSESTRLQIFMRMMSGGKTIVIYANKNYTVEGLQHIIELKAKVPAKENVIYKGEQDSSLHHLGRNVMYAVTQMLTGFWICPRNKLH